MSNFRETLKPKIVELHKSASTKRKKKIMVNENYGIGELRPRKQA